MTPALLNVLYPYQKKFILDKSKFIVWVASRQIGKSFGIASKAVFTAIGGENYIVMSTSLRNARRIIKTCKKIIKIVEVILKKDIILDVDNADELSIQGRGGNSVYT